MAENLKINVQIGGQSELSTFIARINDASTAFFDLTRSVQTVEDEMNKISSAHQSLDTGFQGSSGIIESVGKGLGTMGSAASLLGPRLEAVGGGIGMIGRALKGIHPALTIAGLVVDVISLAADLGVKLNMSENSAKKAADAFKQWSETIDQQNLPALRSQVDALKEQVVWGNKFRKDVSRNINTMQGWADWEAGYRNLVYPWVSLLFPLTQEEARERASQAEKMLMGQERQFISATQSIIDSAKRNKRRLQIELIEDEKERARKLLDLDEEITIERIRKMGGDERRIEETILAVKEEYKQRRVNLEYETVKAESNARQVQQITQQYGGDLKRPFSQGEMGLQRVPGVGTATQAGTFLTESEKLSKSVSVSFGEALTASLAFETSFNAGVSTIAGNIHNWIGGAFERTFKGANSMLEQFVLAATQAFLDLAVKAAAIFFLNLITGGGSAAAATAGKVASSIPAGAGSIRSITPVVTMPSMNAYMIGQQGRLGMQSNNAVLKAIAGLELRTEVSSSGLAVIVESGNRRNARNRV